MKHSPPHILLINPWITDFAAYNLWIKPLGLLYITSLLRENGFQVTLIDCLGFRIKKKKYLDGKFYKVKMEKPQPLKSIPQHYSRYGITEEMLLKRFSKMEKPDVIGITSGMTYWYPGLFKTIEMTKNVFNDVPIILGGIYATLCYEHALRHSGADYIIKGKGELKSLKLVFELTHSKIRSSPKLDDPDYFPLLSLLQPLSSTRLYLYLHVKRMSIPMHLLCLSIFNQWLYKKGSFQGGQ